MSRKTTGTVQRKRRAINGKNQYCPKPVEKYRSIIEIKR
jgi:hypothetical protein